LFNLACQTNPDISLVDPVGLERYIVVKDSSDTELAPSAVGGIQAVIGQTAIGDWVFAAPPASVTSIDVQVGDWPTFDSIPIQR
jgi:hypothetical protein